MCACWLEAWHVHLPWVCVCVCVFGASCVLGACGSNRPRILGLWSNFGYERILDCKSGLSIDLGHEARVLFSMPTLA